MKKYIAGFFRRGIAASGFGPLVLAVLYMVLQRQALLDSLSVREVCVGIFSLSALAFVAGGMNAIYQVERIPLMVAILLHGCVLYIGYLITYLVNGWLERGFAPILVFTGIFVVGYLIIWGIIYSIIKKRTARVNDLLKKQQGEARGKL